MLPRIELYVRMYTPTVFVNIDYQILIGKKVNNEMKATRYVNWVAGHSEPGGSPEIGRSEVRLGSTALGFGIESSGIPRINKRKWRLGGRNWPC